MRFRGATVARSSASVAERQSFDEAYLLSLLSDSNLPTGGFVASSGLESYGVHGFLRQESSIAASASTAVPSTSRDRTAIATINFVRHSLQSYARSALPFLLDAHRLVTAHLAQDEPSDDDCSTALYSLITLDAAYHAFSPNHVLRRASKAQGMALLILYSKSFAPPLPNPSPAQELIDEYKRKVRASSTRDTAPHGHLSICWGIFTAALGMGIDATLSLHLFLQARTVLSSSIRLNTLGPYAAHSLLLHEVREVVRDVKATARSESTPAANPFAQDWNWDDEGAWGQEEEDRGERDFRAPANTWPLGDIVQARHDVLHTRLFNS
ncbi:hypothetical protein BDZ90DRAFT_223067 [Jaminaea rosea]|uniref:Urease accessory protein UreF n=1 Tax=Jaminaea rosea TaxID=1569628 RepID=A0A316UJW8_9BASI|nr:hypothetical protein BDZ90DRAFT_223067 [Jaminaea rosea]PWN25566.1 hypothetical protein BDZ90DRAFT_223067 [Jaminaea rosea]